MKLYYIFLSMVLWCTSYVYSGEHLTPDDLTVVLDELSKDDIWQDKEWFVSAQRHVAELADRIKDDKTITGNELAALKDQVKKAHEIGQARQLTLRGNPALLYKICCHVSAIRELRSSKNKDKHVTFVDDEGPENAE